SLVTIAPEALGWGQQLHTQYIAIERHGPLEVRNRDTHMTEALDHGFCADARGARGRLRKVSQHTQPPSTMSFVPVICRASSEARNATAAAMSSAFVKPPSGVSASSFAITSSRGIWRFSATSVAY